MSDPLLDLDLGAAELYLSVVELGSISKAAVRHGLAQPSASQRIRKLELQVGLTLLDRSASGSGLTPDGRRVAEWCRELVAMATTLVDRSHTLGAHQRLFVSVAATAGVVDWILPQVCAELAGADPTLTVDLRVADTLHACTEVREGASDVGIVDGPRPPLALRSEVIATLPMCVVVGTGHPWANRNTPVDAAELASTPLILRERPSGTRDVVEEQLANAGHARTAIAAAEASDGASLRSLCVLGAGPAVITDIEAERHLAAGRLTCVPDRIGFEQPVRLVWIGDEPHTAGARRFAAACRPCPPVAQGNGMPSDASMRL